MSLKTEEFDKIGYSTVLILRKKYFFGTIVFNFRQNITVLQILRGGGQGQFGKSLHSDFFCDDFPKVIILCS